MNDLNDYYKNSIAANLYNKGQVHVNVNATRQPQTKWTCLHKAKVWCNDQGYYIVNESTNWNGVPNRVFDVYANYEDYDKGAPFDCVHALGKAKLVAEDHANRDS